MPFAVSQSSCCLGLDQDKSSKDSWYKRRYVRIVALTRHRLCWKPPACAAWTLQAQFHLTPAQSRRQAGTQHIVIWQAANFQPSIMGQRHHEHISIVAGSSLVDAPCLLGQFFECTCKTALLAQVKLNALGSAQCKQSKIDLQPCTP